MDRRNLTKPGTKPGTKPETKPGTKPGDGPNLGTEHFSRGELESSQSDSRLTVVHADSFRVAEAKRLAKTKRPRPVAVPPTIKCSVPWFSPACERSAGMKRLGLDGASWCELFSGFGRLFCTVAGRPEPVDI